MNSYEDWTYLLRQTVVIVFSSGITASFLGIAAGILMTRPWFQRFCGYVFPGLQHPLGPCPPLAILAIIMTITGLGFKSAFIGLITVTILPVVRNTYQGISEVPEHMIEAARGQGMTDQQILWKVQIPNALYVITAGIRTGFALNVGTSPLITLIAADSLGEYIFTGHSTQRVQFSFDRVPVGGRPGHRNGFRPVETAVLVLTQRRKPATVCTRITLKRRAWP